MCPPWWWRIRFAQDSSGRAPLDLCLRSALAEEWIDDLVIVDHDNDEDISSTLRAFEADRRDVHVVKVDPSLSTAAAANVGAEAALGRWLLFLNADVVLNAARFRVWLPLAAVRSSRGSLAGVCLIWKGASAKRRAQAPSTRFQRSPLPCNGLRGLRESATRQPKWALCLAR
ncbi:MAG: hypothetical protein IPL62_08220 [Caulobacteraceae bacterium]|nr:hypothetical protein [Caulobacteraceae bacterium]